jgi:probable F420-dependent oxidoreductase
MKFSISIAMSPPEQYVPIARAAEKHGFHAVVLPDSIFYSEIASAKYPYTADGSRMWSEDTPWVEPVVGAAAMAAVTEKLFLYTSVIKLPVRHPVLMARQIGSLSVLSNGRFGFGAGLGWLPEESEWCGQSFATRGKRMDESLEIMRSLWTGEMVEHHGQHYDFGKIQMSPKPPYIPIYIGGHTAPGLRRAAKYDGWSSAMMTEKQITETCTELKRLREEIGRGHLPFEIQAVVTDVYDLDGFKRLEEAGVTDMICVPWLLFGGPFTGGELQPRLDGLARFAEHFVQKLS